MKISPSLAFPLLLLPLLIACSERSRVNSRVDTAPLPKGEEIDEDGIYTLVARGYRLYHGLGTTNEHDAIGGRRVVRVDPKSATSMKGLRAKLGEIFTTRVVDSIVKDLGIQEQGGKLWMTESDRDDISNYDEAEILEVSKDTLGITATIEVPLGDSGQSDERTIAIVKTSAGWKIANNVYSGQALTDDDASATLSSP